MAGQSPHPVDLRNELLDIARTTPLAAEQRLLQLIANFLPNLRRDPELVYRLATNECRDAIVSIASSVRSSMAAGHLSAMIATIACAGARTVEDVFVDVALCDAMMTMSRFVTTGDAVELFCRAIRDLAAGSDAYKTTLQSAATRDALVALSQHATTSDSVFWVAEAMSSLIFGAATGLFGTAAVRDAIVAMSAYATTSDAVTTLSLTICNLTTDARACSAVFGTPPVRDALVAMAAYASTSESVVHVGSAIRNLHNANKSI